MPATFTTLQLSYGGTTLDLLDQTNYELQQDGWAPYVARRRAGRIGGLGAYQEAEETITIDIWGTTGATLLANLAALTQVLDAVDAWQDGDGNPVILKCLPQGSTTSAAWEAVVTTAPDADTLLGIPSSYNDKLMVYVIEGVQLTFQRRNWLAPAETSASTTLQIGNVATRTFGTSAAIPSPLGITMSGFGGSSSSPSLSPFPGGILAVAAASSRISLRNMSVFTSVSAPFSKVTDVAHLSTSAQILRYTPTSTAATMLLLAPDSSFVPANNRTVAIYTVVRPSSSTVEWTIQVDAYDRNMPSAEPTVSLDTVVVPQVTTPTLLWLGTAILPTGMETIRMYLATSSVSGSPYLDMDIVLFVGLDDVTSRVIAMEEAGIGGIASEFDEVYSVSNVGWETAREATMIAANGTATRVIPATGRADTVTTGTTVAFIWYATGSSDDPTMWRATTSFDAVASTPITVTRRKAVLLPQ